MTEAPDNKDKIIETAIDLFAARGFRGTSIRDIAGSMGMSLSNIYHYFGSKEGLLLAILNRSAGKIFKRLLETSQLDIDPLERFQKLLAVHIQMSAESTKEAKVFSLDEEHLTVEGNAINRRNQLEILRLYTNELGILQDAGLVRTKNLTVLAFNILGVINWHLRWYKPEGRLASEEIQQEIISFILHGILGKGSGLAEDGPGD